MSYGGDIRGLWPWGEAAGKVVRDDRDGAFADTAAVSAGSGAVVELKLGDHKVDQILDRLVGDDMGADRLFGACGLIGIP